MVHASVLLVCVRAHACLSIRVIKMYLNVAVHPRNRFDDLRPLVGRRDDLIRSEIGNAMIGIDLSVGKLYLYTHIRTRTRTRTRIRIILVNSKNNTIGFGERYGNYYDNNIISSSSSSRAYCTCRSVRVDVRY
jgi:hypothetical protein